MTLAIQRAALARVRHIFFVLVSLSALFVFTKDGLAWAASGRQSCDDYIVALNDAKSRLGLEGRFPSLALEQYESRELKGNPVLVARNLGASRAYIACDDLGRLASLGVTSPDVDFNVFAALAISAMGSISKEGADRELGSRFFSIYKQAESTLSGDKPGTGSYPISGYSVRITLFPSRALRLEIAAVHQPYMFEASGLGSDKAAAVDPVDETAWRCEPNDPDGIHGMGNFTGNSNVMPPRLPKGKCIILAQPFDLYRAPSKLLGRTVEMKEMGCYRHDEDEYRCVPFMAHRRSAEYGVIIRARAISDQDRINSDCLTLRRGLESRRCKFTIRFKELEFGTDHMETVRWVATDSISIAPE